MFAWLAPTGKCGDLVAGNTDVKAKTPVTVQTVSK